MHNVESYLYGAKAAIYYVGLPKTLMAGTLGDSKSKF
jgi:hypothetical protein